jgi:ribosomal protein S18 acetylase RimI-like enzyme
MRISFRPARPDDFEYCARLYVAEMERTIRELTPDMTTRAAGLRQRWDAAQVRIITGDGEDIGWLQTVVQADAVFIAQFFIDAPFRGGGIGAEVMSRILAEASGSGRAVTLGVVKDNPALRLYRRLGFQITHEDTRKYYMRR